MENSKTYVILPTKGSPSKLVIGPDDNELSKLQEVVGGYIEGVSLSKGMIYVNEEGLIQSLPYNEYASTIANQTLCGNAVMVGETDAEGESGSVDEDIVLYLIGMAYE